MPSYLTPVEGKPIVFNAYLHRISHKDLQETFSKILKLIKKNGQIWLILDLSAWDVTLQDLAGLVGALASRVPGSPYDSHVVTLVVGPVATIAMLQASLADHKAQFEMIHFDTLDAAYKFAEGNIH